MKTTTYLSLGAALLAGIGAGYLYARLGSPATAPVGAAEATFRARVEAYAPTCAQLRGVGLHGPVAVANARVFVRTQADYVYVIGLETPPQGPPMTFWWGAGRAEALRQACGG